MYFAPYIQDDWKVSSKLTLNLGLRWDYRSVPYETNDRMAWRNLDYAPGGLLVADPTARGGRNQDGRTTRRPAAAAPRTPIASRSSLPASASPGGPDEAGKTVDPRRLGTLLSTRPRDARSTARPTSTPT